MSAKKTLTIGINASFLRKPNTGIGQVTANFIKKLAELPISVRQPENQSPIKFILYLEENLPKDFKLPKNFEKRTVLPIWKRDDLVRAMWRDKFTLPRQIQKDGCDVFFSLYQSALVLPKKIRHIMLVHDIILEFFPAYLNNFRKRLFWTLTKGAIKKADKIIAVSKRTEKDLIQNLGMDGEKITVNYIDVDKLYKKTDSVSETTSGSQELLKKYKLKPGYILAGGGMEVRKNVEGVIRAYKVLSDQNKNLHFIPEMPKLVIYGKLLPELWPLTVDAEKLTQELNLMSKVRLLDIVPQKNLPALFKGALMFVYPSHYEGFGMPVLEAMNSGTPVITGKNSSLPEVGGDAVLYCDSRDIYDIAMVMRNVLINKDLRETLSRRGFERSKNFSWEKFLKKTLEIILAP